MDSKPEIAQEDLEGFKGIRRGLGEQVESNVELDAPEEDEQEEEEIPEQKISELGRQPSTISSNIDYEQANEEEQDHLIKESLKKAGLDPEKLEDARPTGKQMQKALKYFDLAIKIEVTLVSNIYPFYFDSTSLNQFY